MSNPTGYEAVIVFEAEVSAKIAEFLSDKHPMTRAAYDKLVHLLDAIILNYQAMGVQIFTDAYAVLTPMSEGTYTVMFHPEGLRTAIQLARLLRIANEDLAKAQAKLGCLRFGA